MKNLRRPDIKFQYENDMNMSLICTTNNNPVPGIKYVFTVYWGSTVLSKQMTTNPVPVPQKVFMEDIFSGHVCCISLS